MNIKLNKQALTNKFYDYSLVYLTKTTLVWIKNEDINIVNNELNLFIDLEMKYKTIEFNLIYCLKEINTQHEYKTGWEILLKNKQRKKQKIYQILKRFNMYGLIKGMFFNKVSK